MSRQFINEQGLSRLVILYVVLAIASVLGISLYIYQTNVQQKSARESSAPKSSPGCPQTQEINVGACASRDIQLPE